MDGAYHGQVRYAGTYGRGVPFINYATTLLAAADASVGGKTAVDTYIHTGFVHLDTTFAIFTLRVVAFLVTFASTR